MNHAPRREELLDLALGLLEPAQAGALEAHVVGCPGCREELAALRRTRELVAGLPPLEAPGSAAPVLAAARAAAAAATASPVSWWAAPRWRWGGTLGLAGAAAVAVLLLRTTPAPLGERAPAPERARVDLAERTPAADAPAPRPPVRTAPPAAAGPPPTLVKALRAAPASEAAEALATASGPGRPAEDTRAAEVAGLAEAAAVAGSAQAAQAGRTAKAAPASRADPVARRSPSLAASAAAAGAAPAAPLRPPCRLEQRRLLTRGDDGTVLRREREGRYPSPDGEVPLLVEERFGPDGRPLGASITAGARTFTVGAAEIEAGRLEPLPGVVLAPSAGEAERAPPRCDP